MSAEETKTRQTYKKREGRTTGAGSIVNAAQLFRVDPLVNIGASRASVVRADIPRVASRSPPALFARHMRKSLHARARDRNPRRSEVTRTKRSLRLNLQRGRKLQSQEYPVVEGSRASARARALSLATSLVRYNFKEPRRDAVRDAFK